MWWQIRSGVIGSTEPQLGRKLQPDVGHVRQPIRFLRPEIPVTRLAGRRGVHRGNSVTRVTDVTKHHGAQLIGRGPYRWRTDGPEKSRCKFPVDEIVIG